MTDERKANVALRVHHVGKLPPREVPFEECPMCGETQKIVEAAKWLLEGLQSLREHGQFGCPFCIPEQDGSHEGGCRVGALAAVLGKETV